MRRRCVLAITLWGALALAPAVAAAGPILAVTRPASFAIDFGAIPRGHLSARTVSIHNPGDAPLEVTLGTPGAPFAAPEIVDVGPGDTASFEISCRAAAATAPALAEVTLTSNAAQSNTAAIAVRCEVADTRLEIAPGALDLGEVRLGAAPHTVPIELRNPGPGPLLLAMVRLDGARPGLRLQPERVEDHTLAAGAVLALSLSVTPSAEVDLEGAALSIEVGAARLSLPIAGAVVRPSAEVTPAALDLGTACVGTQISGTVRLANTGTATLAMQEPQMDRAFITRLDAPATYPAPLAPGFAATVGISPRAAQIGPLDGTLTWDVDAPAGPFSVPVTLRYIDAGAAISPRSLIFGSIAAGREAPRQTVTLENCNPQPIRLAVLGVAAREGDDEAWEVTPATDERTLGPRDKLQLAAVFRPARPGRYVAHIQLEIDGAPGEIELSGDALGEATEPTSFYACDCGGARAPSPGAALPPLAVLCALRRRRRRHLPRPPRSP